LTYKFINIWGVPPHTPPLSLGERLFVNQIWNFWLYPRLNINILYNDY
jgi:hypothetical protein